MGIRVSGSVATAPTARDYSGPSDDDQFESSESRGSDDDLPPIITGYETPPPSPSKASGVYMKELQPQFGKQLIRFMDADAIGHYGYHWIERLQVSAMCFDSAYRVAENDFHSIKIPGNPKCPICEAGVNDKGPQRKAWYSVANFAILGDIPPQKDAKNRAAALAYEEALPAFQLFLLAKTYSSQLKTIRDGLGRHFTQLYFEVQRTGTGRDTAWSFVPKEEEDLERDYPGIDLSAIHQFLESGKPMTPADVPRMSLTRLNEIVNSL